MKTIQLILILLFGLQGIINAKNGLSFYAIRQGENGLDSILKPGDMFGYSIAVLNDFDGDGNNEIAVGAPYTDNDSTLNVGAVWILFMNSDGTVKTQKSLEFNANNSFVPEEGDNIGSVAAMGDLDGNGICDIAVGAFHQNYYGNGRKIDVGSVTILFLDEDANIISSKTHINFGGYSQVVMPSGSIYGVYNYGTSTSFGTAIAPIGDLDNDGTSDFVATTPIAGFSAINTDRGGGFITIMLNKDGSVKYFEPTTALEGYPLVDYFKGMNLGWDVASIGDLDGDGVQDIAVHAKSDTPNDPLGSSELDTIEGSDNGAIYIFFMNKNGTARDAYKIGHSEPALAEELDNHVLFGDGIASLGDLDGDMIPDLITSATQTNDGATNTGVLYILYMNRNGSVKDFSKFDRSTQNFVSHDNAYLGEHISPLGDINHDGIPDFAVSARFGNGTNEGGFYIMTYAAFKVSGVVHASDSLAKNTMVQLINTDNPQDILTTFTDSSGSFTFFQVEKSEYQLNITPSGNYAEHYYPTQLEFPLNIGAHILNLNVDLEAKQKPIPVEKEPNFATKIYPNPGSNTVIIESGKQMVKYEILNSSGGILSQQIFSPSTMVEADVEILKEGVYSFQLLYIDNTNTTHLFVKN